MDATRKFVVKFAPSLGIVLSLGFAPSPARADAGDITKVPTPVAPRISSSRPTDPTQR